MNLRHSSRFNLPSCCLLKKVGPHIGVYRAFPYEKKTVVLVARLMEIFRVRQVQSNFSLRCSSPHGKSPAARRAALALTLYRIRHGCPLGNPAIGKDVLHVWRKLSLWHVSPLVTNFENPGEPLRVIRPYSLTKWPSQVASITKEPNTPKFPAVRLYQGSDCRKDNGIRGNSPP
jgi:hypothetical protein